MLLRAPPTLAITVLVSVAALPGCAGGRVSGDAGPGPGQDSPSDSVPTVPDDTGPDDGAAHTGEVLITEAMSDNHGTLDDGDGDASDWIELFNASGASVDLAGWGLSDDEDEPLLWQFPEGTILLPGEYRVVFASGKGEDGPSGELHTPFALAQAGETLTLTHSDGGTVSSLVVPALERDASWGLEQQVESIIAVTTGSAATLWVSEPAADWTVAGFDDRGWTSVTLGIGFDGGVSDSVPENAALEKPTEQSSDGYGYTGAQAVDGEPSTFSHTGDADLDPTLTIDLEGTFAITSVTLINRDSCCGERLYNITVRVLDSSGATAWTSDVVNPVAEGATPTNPGSTLVLTPPATVNGASVVISKVAVNGAYSSEWMSFGEVVVTGSAASPYAGSITTDVSALMSGISSSVWVRAPFNLDSGAPSTPPTRATLSVRSDDGFTWALNGGTAQGYNDGGDVASTANDATDPVTRTIDPSPVIPGGANVLALRGLNLSVDDDDFLLAPELVLDWITTLSNENAVKTAMFYTPTPGEPNGEGYIGKVVEPTSNPPRGFYDAAFTATLTTTTPGATLVYTLDGSVPALDHGTVVLPADSATPPTAEVPVSTTGILRAAAFLDEWAPSDVATETFLFLDEVIRQPAAPSGAPTVWNSVSEGAWNADYEMDPEIVDDPAYTADLLDGLRGIATLSVVMDPADLFEDNGIYANSAERGDAWKRPASIELILGDGTTAFQEDVGIEVHGWGWRYHSSTLKHSFRLSFSQDYGVSKLEYPWFADSPASKFDSIVLRAGGSKTWLDFRDPANAQYLHDAFARDTARDMGKVDGHATFVHLYLNGLYWGLYNPVERPDAGFGEEHFDTPAGTQDDFDAINRRTVTNEAIDGDLEAYNAMLALADADLSTADGLAAVEGYLDLDDLIDYMLIHQYTVNRDGPCCFDSNNMRGVRFRAAPGTPGALFRFFVWDMEYSLWEATDSTNVDIDIAGSISHVYTRLRDNADFRARYASRAHDILTGSGALTPTASAARYQARADEIFDPLVGESARWGDTYRSAPYTRDVEWQAEYDRLMTDFFPTRSQELIDQLRAGGLY